MKAKRYGVYMMCSYPRAGAIYTGMSGDIPERAAQNAGLKTGGATWAKRYKARHLVYYELLDNYDLARKREDQIKGWKREWKVKLIEGFNPAWTDMREDLAYKLAQ
ncbi:MAG: GIY-YIG nuclease family protein [Alphaproteobacteria bacterium]|nr:MAG: GIY-YIG nuclease family protein [Alphaproteobacteria bacterium]